MNILVISHAHPDFSVGGAEIAAYNLFCALRDTKGSHIVNFLARTNLNILTPGSLTQRKHNEFLWRQEMGSWFSLRTAYPDSMNKDLSHFLLRTRPDVIFINHYAHIGIEVLRAIRKLLPNVFIALTLHEYLAICNRNGQMLKAHTNRLCYRESVDECALCFPDISENEFWLRKNFIMKHFSYVDHFISPSEFLKNRYIEWGLPADRFSVIENGQPTRLNPNNDRRFSVSAKRAVFGFFGQITEYKGVDVFLRAIHQLSVDLRQRASFELHGANLDQQGDWLKDLIKQLADPLIEEGTLRWAGAYPREEVLQRISRVDWVVVPSIWWENSPMIIQEAFVCGKPVICSNVGGMSEKVVDLVTGVHFAVANAFDLAEKLAYLIENPSFQKELSDNIQPPLSYPEVADLHMSLATKHFKESAKG